MDENTNDARNKQLPLPMDWNPIPVRPGRDEMNLIEYPFAVITTQSPKDQRQILQSGTITREGKTVPWSWIVSAGEGHDLPAAREELVYLALLELTDQQKREDGLVVFTMYDLCKRLGWGTGGADYANLKKSLNRLVHATIEANNCFAKGRGNGYFDTVSFHILDMVVLDRQDEDLFGNDTEGYSFVKWSDVMRASIANNYLKPVNLGFLLTLSLPTARRLYRYLDKKRYDPATKQYTRKHWSIGLKLLADHLPIAENRRRPSWIKQTIDPAHEELKARGFLESVEYAKAKGTNEEMVIYTFTNKPPSNSAALPAPKPERSSEEAERVLARAARIALERRLEEEKAAEEALIAGLSDEQRAEAERRTAEFAAGFPGPAFVYKRGGRMWNESLRANQLKVARGES